MNSTNWYIFCPSKIKLRYWNWQENGPSAFTLLSLVGNGNPVGTSQIFDLWSDCHCSSKMDMLCGVWTAIWFCHTLSFCVKVPFVLHSILHWYTLLVTCWHISVLWDSFSSHLPIIYCGQYCTAYWTALISELTNRYMNRLSIGRARARATSVWLWACFYYLLYS